MKYYKFNLRLFFYFIIGFYVCSCQSDESGLFETTVALPLSDTLKSREISIVNHTGLLNPVKIINVDDKYLVISESREEDLFQVYSLPELDYLYSWGRQGRGPDEFMFTPLVEINTADENIILYELGLQQLRIYTVTDTAFVKKEEISLSYENQLDPLTHIRRLNDSLFVADYGTAFEDTNHEYIALQPGINEPLFTFGNYPESDLEGMERYFRYTKTNAANPDGEKFAAFYLYHNLVKIFNSNGVELKAIQINDPFISVDPAEDDYFLFRFLLTATETYLYSLGINTSRQEFSDNIESIKTTLEIWNWDGQPVFRSVFDEPVHGFTVSEKYNRIYAFSSLETHKVFEYELPGILEF
jgi:hypothetical protein